MASCPTPIRLRPRIETTPNTLGWGEPIDKGCGRWDCPACGPGRLIEVRKHIQAGVTDWQARRPQDPPRLVTISYPNQRDLRFENAEHLKQASRDIRNLAGELRERGYQVEYCRVFESTQRGRVHIHAVFVGDRLPKCTPNGAHRRGITGPAANQCYCTTETPCLQKLAHQLGMGWVDIRAIRPGAAAGRYVTKYLTKTSRRHRFPRYARRYATSKAFAPTTLGAIHHDWVASVAAAIDQDHKARGLPPRPAVLWWERVPPDNFGHLLRLAMEVSRDPPTPNDAILNTSTGELLPIPW